MSITYSECVSVALVIQHAKRMRNIVNCGLSGSTTFFHGISFMVRFSTKLYRKQNVSEFSLQFLSETFLILRRIEGNIIINVHRASGKEIVNVITF